jgi:NDP-sugar pyrophosphorylase family protein/lipopolysaccharide/colanic/teichoic acid biosynthesis glycosyltransferase
VQILLLATGEQRKLAVLSDAIPAPLLPIANRPLMSYHIEQLARQGYKNILVSLYWLPGYIEAYFQHGQRWGIELNYILQKNALGNAGAVRWARSLIHDTCLVHPVDMLLDLDVPALLAFHRNCGGAMTLVCTPGPAKGSPVVQLDQDQRVLGLCDSQPDRESVVYTGVLVIEPQVLDLIPQRTKYDFCNDLIPVVLSAGMEVYAYRSTGYFNPLASFEDYQRAQEDVLYVAWNDGAGKIGRSLPNIQKIGGQQAASGIWVGRHTAVHPSARLKPPVMIGENSRVGRNVELGPNVVLGDHVIVDDEASVQRSTVLNNTYIGQLVNIDGRIVNQGMVIDVETQEHLQIVDDFLLGGIYDEIVVSSLRRWFDFWLALFFLVLALPVMVVVGGISLFSTGGVFQRELCARGPLQPANPKRETGRRVFPLLRFRTRRSDGSKPKIGQWLERLELNRLAELWSVVSGELSLVGPKPLSVAEAECLTETWQLAHFDRVPGFTGLWYYQTHARSDLDEVLVVDAYYIAMSNWRKDARLLWNTPRAWLSRVLGHQVKMNIF